MNALRHYCRNPRCRAKLKLPTENVRDAFCCRGCYSGFYRSRCVVCEKTFVRKVEHQQLCGRRSCRNAFRSDRERFIGTRYPSAGYVISTPKNPIKSGLKTRLKSGRAWRKTAGPDIPEVNYRIPLDPETAARIRRMHDRLWSQCCKPVELMGGGYRWPDAPRLDSGTWQSIVWLEIGAMR